MPVKIKNRALLFFFVLYSSYSVQSQVLRIEIVSKPQQHSSDTLFIAGSFNNWNPSSKYFIFQKSDNGKEYIELKGMPQGIVEYKITRGGWNSTEVSSAGSAIFNRILNLRGDTTVQIAVEGWIDDFPSRPPVTSKSKNVFIVDTAFYIPQLNRSRRIWIYLPEGYALSRRHYPVVYMHDGQNLFDNLIAPFGEWGVDEMMDSIKESRQSIVVGIDHGGSTRLTEYNPYASRFGKGEGGAYLEFLVSRLKPFIDSAYRTKKERTYTFIAGSSMGGLISMYAVLKYPDVFGGAAVFSPAFWIAPQMINDAREFKSNYKPAIYFVCGELESDKMVSDMKGVYDAIRQTGNTHLFFKTVPQGRHNEAFWKSEMYDCYNWLQRIKTNK